MEYINVHDMSLKWNMKERKVTSLCREGRIKGSKKIGNEWLIPSDSIKPIDKRTKEFDNNNISYSNSSDKVITYYKNKYKKLKEIKVPMPKLKIKIKISVSNIKKVRR